MQEADFTAFEHEKEIKSLVAVSPGFVTVIVETELQQRPVRAKLLFKLSSRKARVPSLSPVWLIRTRCKT